MKGKKILITLFVMVSMLAMSMQAMASATYKTIYLEPNKLWSDRIDNPGVRTGNYSYVEVTCHSVYPESGSDNFSRMQVRIADMYSNDLSSIYTIKEGDGANKIYLLEGYLNTKNIYYEFRGNSNSDAYAVVTYMDK